MDYDIAIATKSDVELAEDIERQMRWSPIVESRNIEVSVNNGVAMLTGKVDSPFESMKATEEAYEAGAIDVTNELEFGTKP
ncbi:hypothetical protein CKA32_000548 [Geitlerinema sp. FC II]|nr:hypothetical protein CKA32_000548 [Geitlerinema sp. FC II]